MKSSPTYGSDSYFLFLYMPCWKHGAPMVTKPFSDTDSETARLARFPHHYRQNAERDCQFAPRISETISETASAHFEISSGSFISRVMSNAGRTGIGNAISDLRAINAPRNAP